VVIPGQGGRTIFGQGGIIRARRIFGVRAGSTWNKFSYAGLSAGQAGRVES
jgi:hypothetical protein